MLSLGVGPGAGAQGARAHRDRRLAARDDQLVTTQLVGGRRDRGDRATAATGAAATATAPATAPTATADRDGATAAIDRDRRPRRATRAADRPATERRAAASRPRAAATRGDRRPHRPAPPPLPERPKPKRLRPGRAHRKAVLAELRAGAAADRRAGAEGRHPRRAPGDRGRERQAHGRPASRRSTGPSCSTWPRSCCRSCARPTGATAPTPRSPRPTSSTCATSGRSSSPPMPPPATTRPARSPPSCAPSSSRGSTPSRRPLARGPRPRPRRRAASCGRCGSRRGRRRRARSCRPSCARPGRGRGRRRSRPTSTPDRWGAVLDAAAYAPVRTEVTPASVPETPSDELLAAVRKYAGRVPGVAAAFGIDAPARPGWPVAPPAQAAAPVRRRARPEAPGRRDRARRAVGTRPRGRRRGAAPTAGGARRLPRPSPRQRPRTAEAATDRAR